MIPVTVLTGFLGAGKTTLLNRLLKRPEMAGTAVLINEFGEIGLDHLLVERLDEDAVLLNAGCLCCTIRGDLVRSLRDLAARERPIRRVVIETTGLADPAPILQTLMGDPMILSRYVLDGVVTVVDAVTGLATLDTQEEALRQAAVADRIVLTKTDIADPATVAALRSRLAALNPGAPRLTVLMGEVEPAALLEAGPFDPAAKNPDVARWLGAEAAPGPQRHEHGHAHGHGNGHGHGHDHHRHGDHHHHHDVNRHDSRIHSFCLRYEEPLPWDGLATWLEVLSMTKGQHILRMKALLNLAGQERPIVLHAVQHLFHPPLHLPAWPEGDDRSSRLVFILRDLDRAVVEGGLNAFLESARREAAISAPPAA